MHYIDWRDCSQQGVMSYVANESESMMSGHKTYVTN